MSVLILAPHLDDEVLGCASYLGAGSGDPSSACVWYATWTHPDHPEVGYERDRLMNAAGFRATLLLRMTGDEGTNHLDTYPQARLIDEIERQIDRIRPDTLLIPPRSYNQDHRAIHDAALTASRPHDKNHLVRRVLVYEEPETFAPAPGRHAGITPTYFRQVDIDRKIELYRLYPSQVRAHRSPDMLCAIATVRGMVSGLPFAEAFEVVRWIE